MEKFKNHKYHIIFAVVALVILIFIGWRYVGSAEFQRRVKSINSNYNGLDRTLTLYSSTGEKIKSWDGRFDISEDSDNEILFDLNGKRTIINGGIVVVEEN